MRPIRSAGLSLLLVTLGSGWAPSGAADSPAVTLLKEKGLSRSGRLWVIEAEGQALAKMKDLRAAFASHAALAERQALAEQVAARGAQLEERRVEMQDGLNDLNQQINERGILQAGGSPRPGPGGPAQNGSILELIAHRDQVKASLAEITQEQKAFKSQATQGDTRKALDDEVHKSAESIKAALAALRPMVDEVTRRYLELGADSSVKAAIAESSKANPPGLKIGPSEAFKSGIKTLDQAERRLLGKKTTAAPRKKAGRRK